MRNENKNIHIKSMRCICLVSPCPPNHGPSYAQLIKSLNWSVTLPRHSKLEHEFGSLEGYDQDIAQRYLSTFYLRYICQCSAQTYQVCKDFFILEHIFAFLNIFRRAIFVYFVLMHWKYANNKLSNDLHLSPYQAVTARQI